MAIVSVLVSGVVGPYLVHRWSRSQLNWQAGRERANELRDHLDQAALRLTEAHAAITNVATQVAKVKAQEQKARVLATASPQLEEQLAQLRKNTDRLAVRTGSDSKVTSTYQRAMDALIGAVAAINAAGTETGLGEPELEAAHINDQLAEALRTRDEFFDAASSELTGEQQRGVWTEIRERGRRVN